MADVTAKIDSLRVGVSSQFGASQPTITVQYGIRTSLKRIKKPIIVVILIAENSQGKRKYVPSFSTGHDEHGEKLYARSCSNYGQRRNVTDTYATQASQEQAEVDADKLKTLSISNKNGGSPRLGESQWKIVFARVEVWIDGNVIGTYETSETKSAKKNGTIPEDWYIADKYPDKFEYYKY